MAKGGIPLAKALGTDAIQGIAVETWLSATGRPDISVLTNPYPSNIRHHISITTNAQYPQDFFVYGLIASGYSQVAYALTPVTDKWDETIHQVQTAGEASCQVQISGPVGSPARLQAEKVEYDCPWSGKTAAVLDRIPEIAVDVG
jgi:hypothetical protein